MKLRFLVIIFLAIGLFTANAQFSGMPVKAVPGIGKISGSVVDSITGEPLEFANVVIREALEHKEVDGVMADDKGAFRFKELKNAKYEIAVSFIGYQPKVVGVYKINKDITEHQVGKIYLVSSSRVLEEVTVTGQKDLIENKIDRIVYNAERDVTSRGGNAADVLRRTPMLTVDLDGNVSLQGSSNVTVFINGKPSSIMAGSVKDALKMIPADVIQKVEVITQPGAKYDAEGTGGIINIVTKSKKIQGVSGGFNISAGTRSSFMGGNVSVRLGKLGFTGNLGGHAWQGVGESVITRENVIPPDTLFLLQTGDSKNIGGGMFTQIALDYDLNEKNSVTFSAKAPLGLFTNKNNVTTNSGVQRESIPFSFRRESETLNRNLGTDLTLDYKRTFDKDSDREFTVSSQYSYNNRLSKYETDQFNEFSIVNYREVGPNVGLNKELIFAADYVHPIKKNYNLEFGAKGIFRNVSSDIHYDTLNFVTNIFENDSRRENFFDYIQNVGASYAQFTFPLGKDWTGRTGLRYEHTFIEGEVEDAPDFSNDYGTWIPSLLVSYKLNSSTTLKSSYTRRIQRPGMFYLNPYVNFNDPTNISYGNPELLPEITESFEVSGAYSKNFNTLNVNLYYKQTNNQIDNYRFVDSLGITNATYNNLATGYTGGVSVNGGIMKLGKIILNSTLNVFYQKIQSERFVGVRNDAVNFNINGFASVNVTPTWGVTVFGFYQSPKLTTQGKQATWFVYSLGARKEMWKKKGAISFGVDNPFNKWTNINSNFQSSQFSFDSKTKVQGWGVRASVEYRFGKMEFGGNPKKKRKGSLNDDLKQGEGDGMGGSSGGGNR